METANINTTTEYVDTVARDFKTALFIVSLGANLAVFTTWLTFAVIA